MIRRKRKALAYYDDDKSEEKEEEGVEGRLLATYAPASSCPKKKRANDRRTGFTSFRALFAPL